MLTTKDGDMAKALVSGGCVISGEINFDYRAFFLNNGVLCYYPNDYSKSTILAKILLFPRT